MAESPVMEREYIEDTEHGKYLMFTVGEEDYGIPISCPVIDILKMQEITVVPGLPENVRGIINMRGEIITVMDMRLRFNYEPRDYSDRTCIIVIEVRKHLIGLIVDQVEEVMTFDDEELMVPSYRASQSVRERFISHVASREGKNKLIIDCVSLLDQGGIFEDGEGLA